MVVIDALVGHQLACDNRLSMEITCAVGMCQDQTNDPAIDRALSWRYITQRPRIEAKRGHRLGRLASDQPRYKFTYILCGLAIRRALICLTKNRTRAPPPMVQALSDRVTT